MTGLPGREALRIHVMRRLAETLALPLPSPARVSVAFLDDDGPRGGRAMRCAFTVHLPRRPVVRVEGVAETPRLAFDAAFQKLDRRLVRRQERTRDARRRPKKYFAARRLLGAGGEKA